MRIFAGPNGSGKSTLSSLLPPELIGIYLNPDELEWLIRDQGSFDFTSVGIQASDEELASFFEDSGLTAS